MDGKQNIFMPQPQKKGKDNTLLIIFGSIGGVVLLFFLYHWLFQKHTITFRNNTLTSIYIELDGQMDTIPAGGKFDYRAKNNYRLQTQAAAYLLNTRAGLLGQKMEWDIDTVVHAWGNYEFPLYLGPKYFLLRVVNNSSSNIYYVTVSAADFNYKYQYHINIPNDGKTYDMGYYRTLPGLKVDVWNLDKKELVWTEGSNLTYPKLYNQYVSVPFR